MATKTEQVRNLPNGTITTRGYRAADVRKLNAICNIRDNPKPPDSDARGCVILSEGRFAIAISDGDWPDEQARYAGKSLDRAEVMRKHGGIMPEATPPDFRPVFPGKLFFGDDIHTKEYEQLDVPTVDGFTSTRVLVMGKGEEPARAFRGHLTGARTMIDERLAAMLIDRLGLGLHRLTATGDDRETAHADALLLTHGSMIVGLIMPLRLS